jgi:hypothetical protein
MNADKKQSPGDDAVLARLLDAAPPVAADDAFRARLLADFEQAARRPRPLAALADAFGWSILTRPFAPAGLAAGVVALGFAAGASSSLAAPDVSAYVYLAEAVLADDALSQDFSGEIVP